MFGRSNAKTPWSQEAEQAVEVALGQMPVPALMRSVVRGRLRSAAEQAAGVAGHATVQPEDLVQGILDLLPGEMRETVEQRMREGPAGLEKLQDDLQKFKT